MTAYQRKRGNPYRMPHNVYMRTVYLIRDYGRLRGMGSEVSAARVAAIDAALGEIAPEYRQAVFQHVAQSKPYPIIAGEATWRRWQQRFVWHVAELLGEE